jgi:hypothetical protein
VPRRGRRLLQCRGAFRALLLDDPGEDRLGLAGPAVGERGQRLVDAGRRIGVGSLVSERSDRGAEGLQLLLVGGALLLDAAEPGPRRRRLFTRRHELLDDGIGVDRRPLGAPEGEGEAEDDHGERDQEAVAQQQQEGTAAGALAHRGHHLGFEQRAQQGEEQQQREARQDQRVGQIGCDLGEAANSGIAVSNTLHR